MQLDPASSSLSTPINPIPSEHPPRVDYMDSALFKAAQDGDIKPFDEYQGDLHCLVDGRQNTALHIYCRTGGRQADRNERELFVEQLVKKCSSSLLMLPNDRGEIPLHIAAKHGHSDLVEVFIERAKIVQHEDPENGLKQMLRMRDKDGNTAMHKAVESGELAVVFPLLDNLDADFSFSANTSGKTPLYMAIMAKREELVAKILEIYKSGNYKSINYYGGPTGRTALHAALDVRDEGSVKKLIEANKNLTKETDANGWTPLYYAVQSYVGSVQSYDGSIAQLLLVSDPSAAYITDKERGMTALHIAALGGNGDIMEDIISYCPGCCEIVDKRGWNFLHFTVLTLYPEEIHNFLLSDKNKIKDLPITNLVNEKDVNGITPFHLLMFVRQDYIKDDSGRHEYDQVVEFFERHESKEYSRMERKKQIQQLLKDIANDAEVEHLWISPKMIAIVRTVEEEEEKIKEQDIPKHEIEEKARESHLLVATLVATVTFTAAFTVPGGYNEHQGTATLIHDSAFKAFVMTNTLAFVASLLAITFHFFLVMFHGDLKQIVNPSLIRRADQLTVFAMAAMVIAFSTGTYAVLQSSSGIAIAALFFGLIFFPGSLALFIFDFIYSLIKDDQR